MNNKDIIYYHSEVIKTLRFPLAILIVFAHMLPFSQETIYLSLRSKDIYHLISEVISHHLARLSTCCYFIFSGYFFFISLQKWDKNIYFSKLHKKIMMLLIPYFLWNSILILAIYFKNLFFVYIDLPLEKDYLYFSHLSIYDLFYRMPINFPLWFIRDLMIMNILSPLFYFYFRYTRFWGLILLFIIYILVIELPISGFGSISIFYFGVGAYMGIFRIKFVTLSIQFRKLAIIGTLIFLIITLNAINTPLYEHFKRIYLIFGIIIIFNLGDKLLKIKELKRYLESLSSISFFIYVSHEIYIINWLKGALSRSYLSHSGWGMLVGYIIVPFFCIGILIIIYKFLDKFFPKSLKVIVGQRS